jgi:hypothetical protein
MSALADQINDGPMVLASLKVSDINFPAAQATTQENGESCSIERD